MNGFIVTGTDTDIGKTVFAAGLAGALGAHYWKPVQAGVDPEGDKERVAALSGLPPSHILPEAYRLATPASPHLAARIDGIEITAERLALPKVDGPLVVEGAGGLMVPVSESLLMIDLFALWGLPVILCGYTNHANAARILADADGAFVGTCLERDGWGGSIDIERVREYVAIVNSLR